MTDVASRRVLAHLPRRTLVAGAVWAVPTVAVASAAPAMAVSCLQSYTIDWDSSNYVRNSTTSGSYTVPNTGITLSVGANYGSNTASTSSPPTGYTSLKAYSNYCGVSGSLALAYIRGSGTGATNGTTLTLTFSQAVYDVSFTIGDIDGYTNATPVQAGQGGTEYVTTNMCPTTSAITDPTYLGGNGCSTGWHALPNNPLDGNVDNESGTEGNVHVTYSTFTTLTITLWNAYTRGAPAIFLSDITFSVPCTA